MSAGLKHAAASDLQLSKRQLPQLRSNAWFWHFFVLVLSIAVLVLVIDARSGLASDSGTPLIAIMVEQVFRHCCPISITSTVSLSTSTTIAFELQNGGDQCGWRLGGRIDRNSLDDTESVPKPHEPPPKPPKAV